MKAFISYSHQDADLLDKLHEHLSALRRDGLLETWTDREIRAGGEIDKEVDAAMEEAPGFCGSSRTLGRRHQRPPAPISAHQRGIGSMLVASARQLARETIHRTGGLGMIVDAANEDVIGFYTRFGFRRVISTSLRMLLPAASLEGGAEIPEG